MVENFFKLLIPTTETNLPSTKTIELCGKTWALVDFEQLSDAPPYTCISYSWGRDITVISLTNEKKISKRTIPVLETVINSFESTECRDTEIRNLFHGENRISEKLELSYKASEAIWIDALCTPQQQPAFDTCIQNMGEIYKESTQVFVVLKNNCLDTVNKIYDKKSLNLDDYLAISKDDWIDRVWTYPEFVNSKMMFLIAEGKGKIFINEQKFLNAIMTDEHAYADIEDIKLTQKLERMQLLVAANQMKEQSAFQAMAATSRRLVTYQDDRINAMLSVVADALPNIPNKHLLTAAETFMRICEANDDYSFIFSTNQRSKVLGRSWRPIGDEMIPIISDVSVIGNGLSGCLKDTHLQLNNMYRMIPWKSNSIVYSIENFLNTDFSKALFNKLTEHEFTGYNKCIKLEHGYFFTQSAHKRSKNLFVAVSHDVKFHQGAPGLLLRSNDTDINEFCDVGVFIGKAPVISETINVS